MTPWSDMNDYAKAQGYEDTNVAASYSPPGNPCYDGQWCGTVLSLGGMNWSDTNRNFIGRLDEVKVWNITKDSTYFDSYDQASPPRINRVEGAEGSDQLLVYFSEGVYANTGGTGNLQATDFSLVDTNSDNTRSIDSVTHTAGDSTATVMMTQPLIAADINADTLAAAASSIYDEYDTAASTTAVTIVGTQYLPCPTSPVTIGLNEAPGSSIVEDSQSKLKGLVGDASTLTGTAFSGDGGWGNPDSIGDYNYVYFGNNYACMQATTAMTIETRIYTAGIPANTANDSCTAAGVPLPCCTGAGTGTCTDSIRRIFDKEGGSGYELQVWRNLSKPAKFPNFNPPDNVATIALWTVPADSHGGDPWKVMLTDYTACPITNDHWYQVKVVWNTNKSGGTDGQPFVTGEIYVDDQGTDGVAEPAAGAGENWSGYNDCTHSDQSYLDDVKKLYYKDEMIAGDGDFAIGANTNKLEKGGNQFNGLIDWIIWKDSVD
jgi:hypothetical protein